MDVSNDIRDESGHITEDDSAETAELVSRQAILAGCGGIRLARREGCSGGPLRKARHRLRLQRRPQRRCQAHVTYSNCGSPCWHDMVARRSESSVTTRSVVPSAS